MIRNIKINIKNKNCFLKLKKSQISIFIIIALMIIFLISFLIVSNNDSKKQNIQDSNIDNNLNNNPSLLPLKDTIDNCLKLELKKATIISGYRGGFIYDTSNSNNHEYYISGINLPRNLDYNFNLLQNFDLNKNYLSKNVLVYSQKSLYVPRLDSDYIINRGQVNQNIIYSKSIKDDYKNFIFFNILKCLNFDNYKNKGVNINYDNFIGKINTINFNSNYILVNNLDGDIGDIVKVNLGDKIYYGTISSVKNINNLTKITFPQNTLNDISSNNDFYKQYAINTKTKSKINITFEDEKIVAKLYFPINVKNKNSNKLEKYSSSSVSIDIRFKELLLLSNILLNKKNENRSTDLSKINTINRIITNNSALNKFNFSSLKFIKTPINNSAEHKVFVYSIIDDKSKILGNPFIFNFGYENHAPRINLTNLGSNILEENSILIFVSKNQQANIDLKPLTSDKETFDNWVSFYHPFTYSGPDAKFSVTSDGKVSFTGYQERRYSFPITVDDRESSRTRNFVFITGFPDNTNNRAAKSCLIYTSNGIDSIFPVEYDYKNKIFMVLIIIYIHISYH